MWTPTGTRVVLFLFALPFAGVGIGTLVMSVVPSLYEWHQMKSWQPVYAQLSDGGFRSHRSDDSTTYTAYADYSYHYGGANFRSTRAAIFFGGDNIGDFQQQLGRQLEQAKQAGQPIQVWVNPIAPEQAVVNRDLRWEMLGFKLLFVVVFGSLGVGLACFALFGSASHFSNQRTPATASARPWLERKEWASATVQCSTRTQLLFVWGFAWFWNLISLPAAFAGADGIAAGNLIALVAFIFPAIGAGLLYWAIKLTLSWRRFGRVPLQLDPYPGSIGGQVGGSFALPLAHDPAQAFKASLRCLESYTTGSGKNRRTQERIVWQTEGYAYTSAKDNGTLVEVLFDVPRNLPASTAPADRYHLWRLDVEAALPGVDFARSFEIPVFRTGQKSKQLTQRSVDHTVATEAREQSIATTVKITQHAEGIELHSPAFKFPGAKIVLLVIGLVFAAGGVGFGGFALLFTLVGSAMCAGALYWLLLDIRTRIDRESIIVENRVAGVLVKRAQIPRSLLSHLVIETNYSSGTTEYFSLRGVEASGQRHTLASNLPGRDVAKQLLEEVGRLSGLKVGAA